jgi:hypothetical protein
VFQELFRVKLDFEKLFGICRKLSLRLIPVRKERIAMVRFQRLGRVKNGKYLEAIQWAKEVAEHINTKYSPVSLQVYTETFGDVHAIYWHGDYKDLAFFDSSYAQVLSDQGYWAIVMKGMELFIEGSFRDTLMSAV